MSIADNLLKSGVHSIEGFGREDRHGEHDVEFPELVVREKSGDEYDSFTLPVFGAPQLVASVDPNRTALSVSNISGGNVVVGKLDKVNGGRGYLLIPGQKLSIKATGGVWIGPDVPNATNVVQVAVWIERSDG